MIDHADNRAWLEERHRGARVDDAFVKMTEEVGEVGRILYRDRLLGGARFAMRPRSDLADELADVVIAAVSCATLAGIDLPSHVGERWDEVRERS